MPIHNTCDRAAASLHILSTVRSQGTYDGGKGLTAVSRITRRTLAAGLALALAGCNGSGSGSVGSNPFGSIGSLGISGGGGRPNTAATRQAARTRGAENVAVNRYLWAASIDVLSFLPIQSVDPFTGVIVFGLGTPPGGGRAYRATVLISDPALDARSLNVAVQSQGGPVSPETQRAIEDAILGRARQLRIGDATL